MKKILISRTDGLGDLLLATPLIKAVKESEGSPYVAVMASPYAAPVLENNPDVDEVFLYEPAARKRLIKEIREGKFDACVCVYPSFETASLLASCGIKKRIGTAYRWFSPLFFNVPVKIRRKHSVKHEADYNLELVEHITGKKTADRIYYYPTGAEKAAAGEYLTKHGLLPEFVIIHPGSKGSAWNISRQKYAEAADAVSTFAKVLLTGGPAEKAMLMSIMDSMKNGENVVVMEEEMTLRQFAAVISLSSVLVSCSTGPMHLAAAMGVKTLSFFPHDGIRAMRVKRWGPIGNINEIIMPAESRLAPDDAMDTIPVGLIADKVRNLLAR